MSIIKVTDKDFQEIVLKNSEPILCDFWAEWCGPCKQISPILSEIADEYSDKIKIAIDTMGGENSPKKIIDGISISLNKNKNMIIKF